MEVDEELVAAYLAGAVIGTCRVWLACEPRVSALEMSYWFSRMAVPGLFQVMGLEKMLEN